VAKDIAGGVEESASSPSRRVTAGNGTMGITPAGKGELAFVSLVALAEEKIGWGQRLRALRAIWRRAPGLPARTSSTPWPARKANAGAARR
jgi:hypothetical protein